MLFQLYSIVHAQYVPSTNAYSTLHLLVMQVQVLSFQITHRSIFGLQFNNISGESLFFKDDLHDYLPLFLVFSFQYLLDLARACPSISSQLEALIQT